MAFLSVKEVRRFVMVRKELSKLKEKKNCVAVIFHSLFWIPPTQITEINESEFAWESLVRTGLNNEYASVCCVLSECFRSTFF